MNTKYADGAHGFNEEDGMRQKLISTGVFDEPERQNNKFSQQRVEQVEAHNQKLLKTMYDSRNDRMTGMSTLPETYYNSKISKNKGSTNN